MSGWKAPAIPLLGPPPLPPRYSRNGSATTSTARGGRGFTSCAEAGGPSRPTHTKKGHGRGKAMSRSTKVVESSTPANCYNHLTQNDNALQLVSASDHELLVTGKPMSLKEFSKGKRVRDLPCLVKVVDGHSSLCEYYSFGKEQMFVVLEKKNMLVVTCKDHMGGSSYAVPINTTSFHLVPNWMDAEGIRPNSFGKITANELFQSKALPPVVAVSEQFEVSERPKKTVPVGTLLFLKGEKKQVKDQRQGVLHAKSESGEMVQITPDCNGRFSILAKDVRLSLWRALDHLKPPFTMRTISNCDTLYVNVVTVERVHKEDVFIGMMKATEGTSLDDIASFSRMAEVPVSLNLTVVTMAPKQQKILDDIYDFVLAEYVYHRVMHRPAMSLDNPADKVIMDPNPSYSDISMDHMKTVKFSAHSASSVKAAPPTPLARTLPSIPLHLSVTAPYNSEEHIYDAVPIDYYDAKPTASTQQKASPHSKVAGTPFESDQPSAGAVAIDYYETMPTPATQQKASDSEVAGTPFKSGQPPSDAVAIDYYDAMPTAVIQQTASPDSKFPGTPFKSDQPPSDDVAIDYYETMPTAETQQMASADSKVAGTPFEIDQPPSDDVAIDYYVTMPTAETQQMASADSKVAGTPFEIDQPVSEEKVPTSMKQHGSVEDSDGNIAYLKNMQRGDILQLLEAMNLSVYKDAFEQEQIDGEKMACLSGDMLSELGVSKSLHRMRLMKIVSGRTSASSFISTPQFDVQQS